MKIDTMIIGAYKGGSTSLKEYLSEHPKISTHYQNEFDFFKKENQSSDLLIEIISNQFDDKRLNKENKLLAKYVGQYRSEIALKRLKKHNPNCKLIFIIREPIDRAYSAYKMEVERSGYEGKFEDLVEIIKNKNVNNFLYKIAINPSLYGNCLQMILNYFEKNQVFICKFEDLKSNPKKLCEELFDFIGVENNFKPNIEVVHNSSKMPKYKWMQFIIKWLSKSDNPIKKAFKVILPYKFFISIKKGLRQFNQSDKKKFEELPEEIRQQIFYSFKEDIELLEKLSGLDFKQWKM